MAYGLETAGRALGDLVGRGNAALQQGATYGSAGMVGGATFGAAAGTLGVVTGPGELAIEPAAIGSFAAAGGAGGLAYGASKGLIEGTPGFADRGEELGKRLSDWISQMTSAQDKAKARQKTVTTTLDKACETCGCSQLAAGVPGTPYRGGAHAFMQIGGNIQSHHTPPQSVSPLPADVSPAIQMDRLDHYRTQSFGRSSTAPNQLLQKAMIDSGNFMGAVALDAADIRAKFPGKYDAALLQMMVYAQCLKDAGLVR